MTKYGYLISCAIIAILALLVWQNPQITDPITQYVENGQILTLEARFTPEQILANHSKELLGDKKQRTHKTSSLKFYPYLLMDVKYTNPGKKTEEGVLLWSANDGEMVISTDSWEKTHGFEDAINVSATEKDFRIINALAANKGTMTIDQLQKALQLENSIIAPWIESSKAKHLITMRGNEIQLHFQNPKLLVTPQTKMGESIVSKPYSGTDRVGKKYSRSQIEKIAQAAFGTGFTIRGTQEVFLPVYRIEMLNQDGSLLISHWNALTGKKISRR